ncbi:MAG: hypothetical protein NTV34_05535 [Proteobacteria bacterium]|nr:hypothetical protein [Pseudomonadota bacterium]
MFEIALNVVLTASLISLVLWVAKMNPILGGFIVSLPLSTLITLAFSKWRNQEIADTFILAKSIFVAVPLTMLFFLPFLFADRFKLSFWTSYLLGLSLLAVSFILHRWAMAYWTS